MSANSQPSTSSSSGQSQPRNSSSNEQRSEGLDLKTHYLKLIDEVNAIDGSTSLRESFKQIGNVIQKADRLFGKVKDPAVMHLDARVIQSATAAMETTSNNVDVGEGNFHLFTFADQFKLKTITGGSDAPYTALLSVAQPVVCNSIPHWSPLLGSFEFTGPTNSSPQKKARQTRPREAEAAKKEPEKIVNVEKTDKRAEEIVQRIFDKLKKYFKQNKQTPINYFRFILNPTSFAATVENIFYVSFLVNDGHVKLEIDDDELFISPNSGKENSNPQSQQQRPNTKKQNIVSIDMKTWKGLTLVLNVDQAMI